MRAGDTDSESFHSTWFRDITKESGHSFTYAYTWKRSNIRRLVLRGFNLHPTSHVALTSKITHNKAQDNSLANSTREDGSLLPVTKRSCNDQPVSRVIKGECPKYLVLSQQ